MSKSNRRTQECIAPGLLECPYCNEFVESVLKRNAPFTETSSREYQPCGHIVPHVPEQRDLETVESFIGPRGNLQVHDVEAGGRWIESDTTVMDLGVDPQ